MHVLHGTWLLEARRFGVWGEDTSITEWARRGRRPRTTRHPYLVDANQWLRHLGAWLGFAQVVGYQAPLWLPGVNKTPCPSPEALAAGMAMPEGRPELLPWHCDALIGLDPVDALDFLVRLPRPHEAPLGIALGSDLRFWQQAAMLATSCLVEQRYGPALDLAGSQLSAFWEPRLEPELLAQMAAAMPPLCRAVVDEPANAPPPLELLTDFLQSVADAFVRQEASARRRPRHRWIKALIRQERKVVGTVAENRALFQAWQHWQEAATGGALGTFRVCFRLEEPTLDHAGWALRYLLQASDDPGVLVEAETVWADTGTTLQALERRFEHPQEKLLTALGLASRIFAPIERSLRASCPVGVELEQQEAYQFLVEALPLLEANHFSILVPNWWKRAARLKAKVRLEAPEPSSNGLLGRDALLRYRWEMSLGEQTISPAEFEELVALKQPMVRFKGEWVALDPKQVEAALKFFHQETSEGEIGLLDALKLSTQEQSAAEAAGLDVDAVEVGGWLHDLFARLREPGSATAPAVPASFQATLRPYQVRGFGWLTQMRHMGLGACLADDMGLGKTPQTIALWLHEREQLGVRQPALLVCPTSVVGNWRHELGRFAPGLKAMTHQGPARLQGEAFAQAAQGV
ncbi:MAG: SNF2 helicase-associated domain-containing protein, partial [Chloroflexota bacterium]